MKRIAYFILVKLLGWEISGTVPENVTKSVITVAPHTSLWDFVVGRLAFWILNINVKFIINEKYFFWPLGGLLKLLGGVPVKQDKATKVLFQITQLFKTKESFFMVITPEGTRSIAKEWKKGFYQIAKIAKVPVILAFIDYKFKKGGLGPVINITGDFNRDFNDIKNFYKQFHAKHPEKYNLSG